MNTKNSNIKSQLNLLYRKYNKKKYRKYDPIKYVYMFENPTEQELMGLIASSFAFGRVLQIFKALDSVLRITNNEPLKYVLNLKARPDKKLLSFKYRFVTGQDLFDFFSCAKDIIEKHGSLGEFVKKAYDAQGFFKSIEGIIEEFQKTNYLIPMALKKSPCKRLFMFFRWMVRKDNIDLGLWNFINPEELIIPLDTHIFQISRTLGFTTKKSQSFNVANEVTDCLKNFSRNDPIKYDWALAHVGIIKNNFYNLETDNDLDNLIDVHKETKSGNI